VYLENARQAVRDALVPLLVRESLDYGLACAETAFVAVREEAGERIEASVIVPNALPAGWSDQFLAAAAPPMTRSGPAGVRQVRFAAAMAPQSPAWSAGLGAAMLDQRERAKKTGPRTVFRGVPTWENGQAVLLDSSDKFRGTTIRRIEVEYPDGMPSEIDRGLAVWVYADDMAMPRARIRLADLARLGGRPLNVRAGPASGAGRSERSLGDRRPQDDGAVIPGVTERANGVPGPACHAQPSHTTQDPL